MAAISLQEAQADVNVCVTIRTQRLAGRQWFTIPVNYTSYSVGTVF